MSVKSGSVNSSQIRDLKGVLDREKAEIGLFVTLEEPSGPMQLEARTAGVYTSGAVRPRLPAHPDPDHPRVARRERRPNLPVFVLPAFQQAERVAKRAAEQGELFG